jgi:hypothetical protein
MRLYSTRHAWLIVTIYAKDRHAKAEAARNTLRRTPPTTWSTGHPLIGKPNDPRLGA